MPQTTVTFALSRRPGEADQTWVPGNFFWGTFTALLIVPSVLSCPGPLNKKLVHSKSHEANLKRTFLREMHPTAEINGEPLIDEWNKYLHLALPTLKTQFIFVDEEKSTLDWINTSHRHGPCVKESHSRLILQPNIWRWLKLKRPWTLTSFWQYRFWKSDRSHKYIELFRDLSTFTWIQLLFQR